MKKKYQVTLRFIYFFTLCLIIPSITTAGTGAGKKLYHDNFAFTVVPDTIVLDSTFGGFYSWPGRRILSFNQTRNMPPGDQMFIQYRLLDPFCTNTPWQKFNANTYKTNWYNDTVLIAWTNSSNGSVNSSVEFSSWGCNHTGIYFRILYISNTGNQTAYASVSNFIYTNAPTHFEQLDTTYSGNACAPLTVNFNIMGHCSSCDGSSPTDMRNDVDFGDGSDTSIVKLIPNPGNFYYTISHTYAFPGTYNATFHVWNNSGGGFGSIIIPISVSPSASISASNSTTFCTGDSVTLTTPNYSYRSYQWSKGGIDIPGATTSGYTTQVGGAYRVTVTSNITGCSRTTQHATILTKYQFPVPTIIPQGPTTFCAGDSVVLAANTGSGLAYKWKKDGVPISGAISIDYSAKTAGVYKVQEINNYGCKRTSAGTIVTVPCRETKEIRNDGDGISIYPNPSKGLFTIETEGEPISQLAITTLSGQTLHKKEFFGSPFEVRGYEINLTNQPKGIYLIQVITGKQVYNQKIILE